MSSRMAEHVIGFILLMFAFYVFLDGIKDFVRTLRNFG